MTKPLPASSRLYKLLVFLFGGSECQQNLEFHDAQDENPDGIMSKFVKLAKEGKIKSAPEQQNQIIDFDYFVRNSDRVLAENPASKRFIIFKEKFISVEDDSSKKDSVIILTRNGNSFDVLEIIISPDSQEETETRFNLGGNYAQNFSKVGSLKVSSEEELLSALDQHISDKPSLPNVQQPKPPSFAKTALQSTTSYINPYFLFNTILKTASLAFLTIVARNIGSYRAPTDGLLNAGNNFRSTKPFWIEAPADFTRTSNIPTTSFISPHINKILYPDNPPRLLDWNPILDSTNLDEEEVIEENDSSAKRRMIPSIARFASRLLTKPAQKNTEEPSKDLILTSDFTSAEKAIIPTTNSVDEEIINLDLDDIKTIILEESGDGEITKSNPDIADNKDDHTKESAHQTSEDVMASIFALRDIAAVVSPIEVDVFVESVGEQNFLDNAEANDPSISNSQEKFYRVLISHKTASSDDDKTLIDHITYQAARAGNEIKTEFKIIESERESLIEKLKNFATGLSSAALPATSQENTDSNKSDDPEPISEELNNQIEEEAHQETEDNKKEEDHFKFTFLYESGKIFLAAATLEALKNRKTSEADDENKNDNHKKTFEALTETITDPDKVIELKERISINPYDSKTQIYQILYDESASRKYQEGETLSSILDLAEISIMNENKLVRAFAKFFDDKGTLIQQADQIKLTTGDKTILKDHSKILFNTDDADLIKFTKTLLLSKNLTRDYLNKRIKFINNHKKEVYEKIGDDLKAEDLKAIEAIPSKTPKTKTSEKSKVAENLLSHLDSNSFPKLSNNSRS